MPDVEMTQLAADLSPRGMRERAFARECALIAEREEAKAARIRERAGRLALRSNARRKLMLKAAQLDDHAVLMRAASVTGLAA